MHSQHNTNEETLVIFVTRPNDLQLYHNLTTPYKISNPIKEAREWLSTPLPQMYRQQVAN